MKQALAIVGSLVVVAAVLGQPVGQESAPQGGEVWRGVLSLGVQVTDENGQAVAGAIVALRFSGDTGSAGPPLVETDVEGRAEISSLAAGEWQADVRRDGYMLYTAYLDLEAGQPPELGFRTRQRTGSFWAPLEVRFYDPESRVVLGSGRLLDEEDQKKEERRLVKEEKRRRKREERPDVAVIVEEPPPVEVAAAPPSPEVSTRSAAAAAPRGAEGTAAATPVAAPAPERSTDSVAPEVPERPLARAEPPAVLPVTAETPQAPQDVDGAASTSEEPAPADESPPSAETSESTTSTEVAPVVASLPVDVTPEPPAPPAARADASEADEAPAARAPEQPTSAPAPLPAAAAEISVAEAEAPVAAGVEDSGAEAPPPASAAVDRPAIEPAPLRLPSIRPNPNLLPAGACPECRPGEWSLAAEGVAAPRQADAACDADLAARLAEASDLVAETLPVELRGFAGSLVDPRGGDDVLRLLPPAAGQQVAEALAPAIEARAGCQVVGVVLPRGARYIGFRYQAADAGSGPGECPPGGDCQIGEARWLGNPVLERSPEVTVVYALFENRSRERERRPRLIVYFKPGSGWAPPAPR